MSHSYNYQLSFWDEQDNGTRILLDHVAQGIEASKSLVGFFEERSKLEKDYSRRLSAISNKLQNDISNRPDYGKLAQNVKALQTTQERWSQSHSKQSVGIHRDNYEEMREFVQDIQARCKTISSKVRNLRNDKITKRQLCDVVQEKLEKASVELRDCQLNKNNTLGKRESSQNDKHLNKWRSIVDELQMKLEVLKQEYRASSKHWLHEWSRLSLELQELEKTRIQYMKLKLQQFAKHCSDSSVEEQICMEQFTQQLSKFTADQDISSFAYNHGTGRIKGNFVHASSFDASGTGADTSRSRHAENVRHLSSQLQRSRISAKDSIVPPDVPPKDNPSSQGESFTGRSSVNGALPSKTDNEHHCERRLKPPQEDVRLSTSSASSHDSSNTTDFTTDIRHRASMESMSTSISSLAHSIEDSQRFAKSWNSHNRRRSKTRSQIFTASQDREHDICSRSSSMETTKIRSRPQVETSQRRKSMVWSESSTDPLKDALEAMKRSKSEHSNSSFAEYENTTSNKHLIPFPAGQPSDPKPEKKRVMDNGRVVELPLLSSRGEKAIHYAKALYTFMDPNDQQIVNFKVDDYLLITEQLDKDWYIGEVLNDESVDTSYRFGIIPENYIEILA